MDPVFIFLTDGEGAYEEEAIKLLKEASTKSKNLLTFAVGFGNSYKRESLKNIAVAGNTKRKWYQLEDKAPSDDCIIEIGKQKISLVIECKDGDALA